MIKRELTTAMLSGSDSATIDVRREEEKYLLPCDLSRRYPAGPTEETLANWRSAAQRTGINKGPPFSRIGGRIYYPLSGVLAWEARRTVG